MYELRNSFIDRAISRHRTAFAAGRAARKYSAASKRANGESSYVPFALRKLVDGEWLDVRLHEWGDTDVEDYHRGLNEVAS